MDRVEDQREYRDADREVPDLVVSEEGERQRRGHRQSDETAGAARCAKQHQHQRELAEKQDAADPREGGIRGRRGCFGPSRGAIDQRHRQIAEMTLEVQLLMRARHRDVALELVAILRVVVAVAHEAVSLELMVERHRNHGEPAYPF